MRTVNPCLCIRCGTSRGPFFDAADLPGSQLRQALLPRGMQGESPKLETAVDAVARSRYRPGRHIPVPNDTCTHQLASRSDLAGADRFEPLRHHARRDTAADKADKAAPYRREATPAHPHVRLRILFREVYSAR